jgi:hypothetical protein
LGGKQIEFAQASPRRQRAAGLINDILDLS